MSELDYDCGRFNGKVKTTEQWIKEHSVHGKLALQNFHPSKPSWRWRVCPCGAKHLIDTEGEDQ